MAGEPGGCQVGGSRRNLSGDRKEKQFSSLPSAPFQPDMAYLAVLESSLAGWVVEGLLAQELGGKQRLGEGSSPGEGVCLTQLSVIRHIHFKVFHKLIRTGLARITY